MEEILSSIRRVMAREDAEGVAPTKRRQKAAESHDEQPSPIASADEVDAGDDVLEIGETTAEVEDAAIVSESSANAASESLNALNAAVAQNQAAAKPDMIVGGGSLDAMVRDMIRPMLKEWLDANLPHIVEDMVAEEIARIARKRG